MLAGDVNRQLCPFNIWLVFMVDFMDIIAIKPDIQFANRNF